MFKNEYQGGPYFEIFSVHGKDPVANWRLTGGAGVRKAYDKEVKSFVYSLEGSVATTKMQLPKDSKQALTLIQRYLVFQLHVPQGQDFSLDVGLTDLQNNKRRLVFSTSHKEVSLTPLHAKIPLTIMRRATWVNLCLDMVSLVGETWRGQTFKATESITLSANCKLRRIFSMKTQPPDDDDLFAHVSSSEVDMIPRQFQIPHDVSHFTQVLTMTKIRHPQGDKSGDLSNRPSSALDIDLSSSGSRRSGQYHIAFGSKVPLPSGSSANKKVAAGRDGNTSSRKSLSKSRSDELNGEMSSRETAYRDLESALEIHDEDSSIEPAHYRLGSDPGTQVDHAQAEKGGSLGSGSINRNDERPLHAPHPPNVAPHPPSGPSNDRVRRRIHRVKSASKDKVASGQNLAVKDIPYDDSSTSSYSSYSKYGDGSIRPKQSHDLPTRRHHPSSEDDTDERYHDEKPSASSRLEPKGFPEESVQESLRNDYDEELGIINDSAPSEDEEVETKELFAEDNDGRDDSMDAMIQALRAQADRTDVGSDEENEDVIKNSYEDSEEEDKKSYNAEVYMFHSPPKPASRRIVDEEPRSQSMMSQLSSRSHPRIVMEAATNSRGARPADDFHSSVSSEEEEQVAERLSRLSPKPSARLSPKPGSGQSRKARSPRRSPIVSDIEINLKQNGESSVNTSSNNEEDTDEGQRSRPKLDPAAYQSIVSGHNKALNSNTSMKLHKSVNSLSVTVPENALLSPAGSQSRHSISKKKVREIPKSDARLSQLNLVAEQPYDEHKYEMGEVSDSFEARMLESLKRQADESAGEDEDENDEAGPLRKPQNHAAVHDLAKHAYDDDDSLSSSDEDTTSFSTWKSPVPTLLPHHYQDEMHLASSRTSQDTLGSSNPRDWSGVFSPPIVLPSEMKRDPKPEELSPREQPPQPRQKSSDSRGRRSRLNSQGETALEQDTDEEDELDLLYDPCLNCYFDPKTCRYYELV
ncbi:protein CFAP20DC-like [Lineus longissimus]|uniref:protein CFAP20DC-like n=1 Tax=Lineus longissimus TaxID=88925 RepID=UPI002B4EBD54